MKRLRAMLVFGVVIAILPASARAAKAGPPAAVVPGEDWVPYRSQRGHFEVDRPTTWTAEDRIDRDGALVTTFTGPGGATIAILARAGHDIAPDDSDLPNTRCRPVTIGNHAARTCLDTTSFALVTTVAVGGRTYRITGSRRRGDERVYDRMVSSFRLLP